jgi:hypothetical protein
LQLPILPVSTFLVVGLVDLVDTLLVWTILAKHILERFHLVNTVSNINKLMIKQLFSHSALSIKEMTSLL